MQKTLSHSGDPDKGMKLILSSLVVLAFLVIIPQAFAISELKPLSNTLENTELHGESAVITLDIKFGADEYQPLLTRTIVHPQLEMVSILFYGDEIRLSEPELRVVGDGRHFRISSLTDGIIIYGHQNKELGNYKINVLVVTDKGFQKFTVYSAAHIEDDKVVETIIEEKSTFVYKPELEIVVEQDGKTFWKQDFNIEVKSYDARINPSLTGFEGKLNDVNITVIISLGEEIITTLKGITEYGGWEGTHYVKENLVQAGEYTVDVIASIGEQSISKSSTFFVIGETTSSGSSQHSPIAIATADDTTPTHSATVNLDGTSSSDSDGDTLTFSWIETSSFGLTINNANTATPSFDTIGAGQTYVIQLTVTDTTGRTGTDTITIIVTP